MDPSLRIDSGNSSKRRGGLVDFIRARPERVLEQWEASERTSPGFAEALRDHVGELLLRVTAHMERGRGALALEGIELRARAGEIASEVSLLRAAVLDAWIDDGGGALDPEEVARLGRAVDALLAAALARWGDGVVRHEVTTGEITRPERPPITPAPFDQAELTRLVEILGRELRAPLHAVAFSMARLLEDHELPDAVRSGVQKTARGAARMVAKVDDVLDFAKVRIHGGIALSRRAVNLVDVARAVIEREDAAPGARRTRLHAEGDTTGFWDKERIAQLIACLMANARRHGDVGPVEVCVRGTPECVELHVENRGTLDVEALSRLFQPFRPRDAQRGLGLGLFLVEAIARAHGGAVSATSASGRTVFIVRLPRAPW